ncbi:hypothetical protein, partial [Streptomyces sp. NPDC006307]|uniref:hypothetical protein n=1 Tax=Streptomyces sp. NPDC006307 TaxID=3156748 RepID=UPI0033B9384A
MFRRVQAEAGGVGRGVGGVQPVPGALEGVRRQVDRLAPAATEEAVPVDAAAPREEPAEGRHELVGFGAVLAEGGGGVGEGAEDGVGAD